MRYISNFPNRDRHTRIRFNQRRLERVRGSQRKDDMSLDAIVFAIRNKLDITVRCRKLLIRVCREQGIAPSNDKLIRKRRVLNSRRDGCVI